MAWACSRAARSAPLPLVDWPAAWHGVVSPDHSNDAAALHEKLERIIMQLFFHNRDNYLDVMHHAIALNSSFFHPHRMLRQYVLKAYL
jgi:hypothetical protein